MEMSAKVNFLTEHFLLGMPAESLDILSSNFCRSCKKEVEYFGIVGTGTFGDLSEIFILLTPRHGQTSDYGLIRFSVV